MKRILRSIGCGLALALPLGGAVAQTAPPVLNAPSGQAPAAPAQAAPASAEPQAYGPYLPGRVYRIETMQSTSFIAKLISVNLTVLEFDAKELGIIKLDRSQIRLAELQGPISATVYSDYYEIGNGNRLFFAPTGRGLRKGEGTLQEVNVYLVGVNYGVSDNLSLGGYVSLIPGTAPKNQFLVFTPKLSYPMGKNVHAGFGALYMRMPRFDSTGTSVGAGIGYGVLTYGSADNNITAGVGYGLVQGDIGATPIIQIGGQARITQLISLVCENYIVADRQAGAVGIFGIKLNWQRASLGLGSSYYYEFNHMETQYSGYFNANGQFVSSSQKVNIGGKAQPNPILPVYIDFSFRFGKGTAKKTPARN